MGIRDWFNGLFRKSEPPADMVLFYDFEIGEPVRIPRRELRPGAVLAQIDGIDEPAWVLPEQLQPGPIQHEPFEEEVLDYLRDIQTAFAEHYPLTLDQWEEGFRRDTNPAQEIAMWMHAANVYLHFAADDPSADRRRDVYRCIMACMTASPDSVWDVLEPEVLDRAEAERVVNRFYGKGE